MCKLVSNIKGSRWSFYDGYQIYGNVVWLCNEDEISKYKLINEKGEEININPREFLVK